MTLAKQASIEAYIQNGTINMATKTGHYTMAQLMTMKVLMIVASSADFTNNFTIIIFAICTITYHGTLVHGSRFYPSKLADFAMLVSYGYCL